MRVQWSDDHFNKFNRIINYILFVFVIYRLFLSTTSVEETFPTLFNETFINVQSNTPWETEVVTYEQRDNVYTKLHPINKFYMKYMEYEKLLSEAVCS